MGDKKLTPKQSLFIKEYLIDLNATQAAIRAGYSEKTANEQGCQNLAKLNISEAVNKALQERAEQLDIDAEWVLRKAVELVKQFQANDNPAAVSALNLVAKHAAVDAYAADKVRQETTVTFSGLPDDEKESLRDEINASIGSLPEQLH